MQTKLKISLIIGGVIILAAIVFAGISYSRQPTELGGTITISGLPDLAAIPASDDEFILVDTSNSATKKVDYSYLITGASSILNLDFNPFRAAYFIGTSTATSTLSSLSSGGLISAPYFFATSSTATSTFTYGINLNGGCFATNGTCLSNAVGSVTSVGVITPIGLKVSGSPITSSGDFTLAYDILDTYIPFGGSSNVMATSTGLIFNNTASKLTVLNASTTALSVSDNLYLPLGIWNSSGNVGIGTSSPYSMLSVAGQGVFEYLTATSTASTSTLPRLTATSIGIGESYLVDTATSTFSKGIDIKSGCFALNGTCITGGGSYTGSFGQIAYFDGTNSLVGTSSITIGTDGIPIIGIGIETMRVTGGKVGISTTSPYAMLSVAGQIVAGYFTATSTVASVFPNASTTLLTANSSWTTNSSSTLLSATWAGFTYSTSTSISVTGTSYLTTLMGTLDAGGATSFEIPNGASPTVDAAGEIAVDTTSDQLIWFGSSKRVVSGNLYPAFSYSTTTAWTGTSTIPLGTAFVAETWNQVQCFTNAGTLNVVFSDGTNNMNLLNASTTVGTVQLTTNNTFTAGEKRYVDVGTPATSPGQISCTLNKNLTAD